MIKSQGQVHSLTGTFKGPKAGSKVDGKFKSEISNNSLRYFTKESS